MVEAVVKSMVFEYGEEREYPSDKSVKGKRSA